MHLIAVTTSVRALVQTGEPPNLAREGDPIGLTAVVTGRAVCYPLEISADSPFFSVSLDR